MKTKGIVSIFVVLCMLLCWTTGFASAAESKAATVTPCSVTYVNPLYADEITEEDLITQADVPVPLSGDTESFTTVAEAGAYLREGMEARLPVVEINYQTDTYSEEIGRELFGSFLNIALQHTGSPTEGDYIRWQYAGYNGSMSGSVSGGTYYLTYTYTITYYTDAEQEAQMDTAVANLLSSLDLSGSKYEKLCTVYDWICKNISYDYANLEDSSYMLKYTAYAALLNGTAVCQGYAVLLYRLALEMGIDCRLISGTGNGGAHGWNIIKLGDVYYNVDSTWDAGRSSYSYFLKGADNFTDHVRDAEYETEAFHATYPTSAADYDPDAVISEPTVVASGTCGENLTWTLDSEGRLTISGTGTMTDFWFASVPWHGYSVDIVSVVLEDGVTSIGDYAFNDCGSLTDITIPDGVTSIGDAVFYGCSSLTSINVPNTVNSIGVTAFSHCSNLKMITVDAGNSNYSAVDGVLFDKSRSVLISYPGGKSETYIIPDGVTGIGESAFHGCSNLTGITLPDSVTSICSMAFHACDNLISVTVPEGVTNIGDWAFGLCNSLTKIIFCGDAPEFTCDEDSLSANTFYGVTATAYYPNGNATWTEEVRQNYSGTITWMEMFEITDGADSVVIAGSEQEVSIRMDHDFSKFVGVLLDGVEVAPANYTVSEDGTIVTFKPEFLATLAMGEHYVIIEFSDGVTVTTLTIADYIPGDINGDGTVNNKDLTRLFQYLSGWDIGVNENTLDINGDGSVNNKDLTRLFQYLSGWDVKIY